MSEDQAKIVGIEAITAKLIRHMGTSTTPAESAWVSTGKEDKTEEEAFELIKRLIADRHFGCFEHNVATFMIDAPIFIARQFMRHRVFSYNELSGRYKDLRDQAIYCHPHLVYENEGIISDLYQSIPLLYAQLRKSGHKREVARQVLPLATMTKFVVTGNLRSWAHFIQLRDDNHAQAEIQHLAVQIRDTLTAIWPELSAIFDRSVEVFE